MKKYIITIFIILLFVEANAGEILIPEGYRMPTETELSFPIRDSDENRFTKVRGDFNGDGFTDSAVLAVDLAKTKVALFVFLSTESGVSHKNFKLETLDYASVKFTGIKGVSPKILKIYLNSRDENKSQFKLTNDSIELFQFEGSSSVFYYDKEIRSFSRIWISK